MLWSVLDGLVGPGVTFLVGLVLARMLAPSEYGLMAIVAVVVAVSKSLVDCGFSSALIRKARVARREYNTVFLFNVMVAVFLYILLYFVASSLSEFFGQPVLRPLARVVGLVLIVNALSIIPRTIFVRAVDFRSQMLASLFSSLLSGGIGIGMALGGFGVWSLVGQELSRQIVFTAVLWSISRWVPRWEFSIQAFREMFSYGSKLLVSGLLSTLYSNVFYFVIGKFYTPSALGQYTRAEQFNSMFSANFTSVIQRVSFPVLSQMRGEPERLLVGYRRIVKSSMLISFGAMLGLAAVAEPLLVVLIGEQWLAAASYLQILCFAGVLYPLHAINLNILQVMGRSDLFLRLEVYKKLLGVIPIVIGVYFGIIAMLVAIVLNSYCAYFLNSRYSAELLSYSVLAQVKDVLPSFLISVFVGLSMWAVSLLVLGYVWQLVVQLSLGGGLYITVYEVLQLDAYVEVKSVFLRHVLGSVREK